MDVARRINLLRIVRTVSIAYFFLLSSVVPSTVLAVGGVIATNNCHILNGAKGIPRPTVDESVKNMGSPGMSTATTPGSRTQRPPHLKPKRKSTYGLWVIATVSRLP